MSQDESTPPDVKEIALKCKDNMIPEKSRDTYERHWNNFEAWIKEKKVSRITQNVILAYFHEIMPKYKASSLWTILSAIKAISKTKPNVNLGDLECVHAVLKQKQSKETVKKSPVFTRDQMDKFLQEAQGMKYLVPKLALLFSINGALRGCELNRLKFGDVTIYSDHLMVRVNNTKRNPEGRSFFLLEDKENPWKCPLKLYLEYLSALGDTPDPNGKMWRQYRDASKGFTQQVHGKNFFGDLPCKIAKFLKLDNPKSYTGHAFRRTSATTAVDNGVDLLNLKRLGGWKSDTVAEGYIAESDAAKRKIATAVQNLDQEPEKKKIKIQEEIFPARHLVFQNLNNCSITINYLKQPESPIGENKTA
jgi:integrase